MKQKVLIALLFFVGLVVFVVALMPAKHILYRLNLGPHVQVYDVSGTIWQGRSGLVRIQQQALENVQWQLSAWSFITGRAHVDFTVANLRQSDTISASGSLSYDFFDNRLELGKTRATMPAELLLAQAKLPIPVLAQGRFNVDIQRAVFSGTPQFSCAALNATGQWNNAGVLGQSGLIPLGEFDAAVNCANNAYTLRVEEPNDLGLSFTATGPNLAQLRVKGTFKLPPDAPNDLKQVAMFFGEPNASGYTVFTF